jgi:hypothetical protein
MGDSGYVSLDSRVKGACRCIVCSANPEIRKWYANDVMCRFDPSVVCSRVDGSGRPVCFEKYKGRVLRCSHFRSARSARL